METSHSLAVSCSFPAPPTPPARHSPGTAAANRRGLSGPKAERSGVVLASLSVPFHLFPPPRPPQRSLPWLPALPPLPLPPQLPLHAALQGLALAPGSFQTPSPGGTFWACSYCIPLLWHLSVFLHPRSVVQPPCPSPDSYRPRLPR